MQQLAHIDKEAKGASLPTPIVTMANAVAGLVRQIFKANGQPLAAPQQSAVQHARHTPALPAPTRPEFDITPDLKQKEKVPVQRKGDDEEQGVAEVAPPGAKAERMVRHIKQGYARDGNLTPKEKGIAFATAWKAHNAGQVEEGEITKNATGLKHRATDKYGAGDDEPHHYTGGRSGFSEPGKYARDLEHVNKQLVKDLDASMGITWKNRGPKGLEVDEQDVAEGRRTGEYSRVLQALRLYYPDKFSMEELNTPDWHRVIAYKADVPVEYAGKVINDFTRPEDDEQDVTEDSHDPAKDELIDALQYHSVDDPRELYATLKEIGRGFKTPVAKQIRMALRSLSPDDAYELWETALDIAGVTQDDLDIDNDMDYSQDVAATKHKIHKTIYIESATKGRQIDEVFADQGSGSTDRDNADYMKKRNAAKKAGYTGRETKAGTWRVFKDGNAVAAAGPFKSADEAAAWIKKHKQGITEMDKSQPGAGRDTGPREGPEKIAKPITPEKMVKHALDTLTKSMDKKDDKKKDVKESDSLMLKLKRALVKEGRVKELADDLKTMSDADFMKKYGKAKAAIRKDMKRVDEARTDYTPDEMADMLSGKRSQKQIDADAERTRGPNKAPPTKESTQSRAKRLNEKMSTGDTLAAGTGISRLSKKDMGPKLDFRTGLDVGDDETDYETENEPELGTFRMGKPVEPDDADTNAFVAALTPGQQDNRFTAPAGWRYVEKDEDPAAAPAKKEVQWIPSSEADSIASWKANNPGKSAADWGPASIPAASKSSAAGGAPKTRWNVFTHEIEKLDPRTGTWTKMSDGSGANPNIDDATRDRARAWAAQQNAPGAALAGAMRSSGNPVDTAKKKADWKSIYNLNKSTIGNDPNRIRPGMKLKMPDGSTYSVQSGDTLSKIAAGQINELSTNKLAQYKTAAAKDARQADQEGDFKRGDKRFHGIVQATKKQFDNDAKKVDESRAARRALMARIVNSR
jgi:hypothetical protein